MTNVPSVLARGLKHAEAGSISILEYHVHAVRDLRERRFLSRR